MDQPHPNAALGLEPIRTIRREELKAKLDRGDAFKLIMALNRWAFDARHIPGSIHFYTPDQLYAAVRPDDDVIRPPWPEATTTGENAACPAKLGPPWCE